MSEDLKDRVVTNLILRGEPEAAKNFLQIIKDIKPNPDAENSYLW